jgi:hypothetical protein
LLEHIVATTETNTIVENYCKIGTKIIVETLGKVRTDTITGTCSCNNGDQVSAGSRQWSKTTLSQQ